MIIFLDFDNTLFDADRFISYIDEHPNFADELARENPAAPFSGWLYSDVVDFIKDAKVSGAKVVICSAALDVELQLAKIAATGVGELVDDAIVTPVGKSGVILDQLAKFNERVRDGYFVDDMPMFLNDVHLQVPGIHCIRIERKPLPSFVEMRHDRASEEMLIASLDELRPVLGID